MRLQPVVSDRRYCFAASIARSKAIGHVVAATIRIRPMSDVHLIRPRKRRLDSRHRRPYGITNVCKRIIWNIRDPPIQMRKKAIEQLAQRTSHGKDIDWKISRFLLWLAKAVARKAWIRSTLTGTFQVAQKVGSHHGTETVRDDDYLRVERLPLLIRLLGDVAQQGSHCARRSSPAEFSSGVRYAGSCPHQELRRE